MTAATECPDGEYQQNTGQTSCQSCDAGHECSDKTATPNPCAAGQYATANSITCTACPSGRFLIHTFLNIGPDKHALL